MSDLILSLKKKWFDMTDPENKTEDYREITPYWCARFFLVEGKKSLKNGGKDFFYTTMEMLSVLTNQSYLKIY